MLIIETAKEIVGCTCRRSGAFALFRNFFLRNHALILVYHSPTPQGFGRHLGFLSRFFSFVSLDDLAQSLAKKDFTALPAFPLVISFDDGHASNYLLLDALQKHNVNPVIYCCSAIVGTNRRFWWKSGCRALEFLKRLPADKMLSLLKKETGYEPDKEYDERSALSVDEIRNLLLYVTIGSHTRFHPILPKCDDTTCADEIRGSREELERLTGATIRHFALPNGDGGSRESIQARAAGYATVRTTKYGWVSQTSDPLSLRAVEIQHDASLNILCAEIMGINAFLRRLFGKLYLR